MPTETCLGPFEEDGLYDFFLPSRGIGFRESHGVDDPGCLGLSAKGRASEAAPGILPRSRLPHCPLCFPMISATMAEMFFQTRWRKKLTKVDELLGLSEV
jgi:hypothetical protein